MRLLTVGTGCLYDINPEKSARFWGLVQDTESVQFFEKKTLRLVL